MLKKEFNCIWHTHTYTHMCIYLHIHYMYIIYMRWYIHTCTCLYMSFTDLKSVVGIKKKRFAICCINPVPHIFIWPASEVRRKIIPALNLWIHVPKPHILGFFPSFISYSLLLMFSNWFWKLHHIYFDYDAVF